MMGAKFLAALGVAVALGACSKANEPADKPCNAPADCTNPAEPYCVQGVCHACNGPSACTADAPRCSPDDFVCSGCVGDLDCSAYPSMPRCSTTDGVCVGCVDASQCENPYPACDATDRACRGCIADSECPSAICDRSTGACVDEAIAVYASPAGTDNEPCTKSAPCTVAKAIATADTARPVVKLAPGEYAIGDLVITGKPVTLYGFDATIALPTSANSALSVRDGADVAVRGLTIVAEIGAGIEVTTTAVAQPTPTLDIDLMTFRGLQPYHLNILHGTATVTRSRFTSTNFAAPLVVADGNGAGAVGEMTMDRCWFEGGLAVLAIDGGKLHIANSVWKGVRDGAFQPLYGGSGDVTFSTFVDSPIDCGIAPNGQPAVAMSNNIAVASAVANVASGTACTHRYSIFYPQTSDPQGSNNLRVDPQLVSIPSGDYHLAPTSPAIDAADPAATAQHDHEGVARPQGGARDIGAFEHKP